MAATPREVHVQIKADATPVKAALDRLRERIDALRSTDLAAALLGTLDDAIAHFEIYAAHGDDCQVGPLAIRATLIRRRREILEVVRAARGYAEAEHVAHVLRGEHAADCTDCVGDMDEKP
jgi:hypothetical protein